MKNYFKNDWNVSVDDAIGKLDFMAIQKSSNGIVRVLEEFPQARNTLKTLGVNKSGVMCATFDGGINFNPGYYDDIANLESMVQGNITGFHPKNTGLLETGSHEMGHILERALIEKNGNTYLDKITYWRDCTQAKQIVSEACKAAKRRLKVKD